MEWGKYVAYYESSPGLWTCCNFHNEEPVVGALPKDEGYLYFYKNIDTPHDKKSS